MISGIRSFQSAAFLVLGTMHFTLTQPAYLTQDAVQREKTMSTHAKGTFEVKIAPVPPDGKYENSTTMGRMTIDKQFHGDLDGTSVGQMLTGGAVQTGSGGYVAMEQVTGKLQGHSGTFIFQHAGTMDHKVPHLSVTVVPESGTGELTGLTGKMDIIITNGKHSYDFEYELERRE